MTRISAADGMISFVPGAGSYFYETVPCIDAVASGYRAIAFTMRAPPDSSITLEMQTMSSCADPTHHSTYRYVMDFTGDLQRVTIPLSSFVGADTTAISGFSWATWEFYGDKNFVWQLGDVEFICGADAAKGLDGVELPTRSLSGNSTETV
ncbi:hypothetical protein M426DRAFT_137384 [Hypoxylon sp. CI-4A]|nr:hypothetical protein M426DRAFT_137384 [Hypoxylon sp. CI-4A]